ncbi:SpoIIE family protein phosphatase [bacterium]|nr:SpoIIE family protein phosphatase [bacterium]
MFNTIKSKINLITMLMLTTLCIVLSLFGFLYLKSGKTLIIKGTSFSISVFAQNINKEITEIENNARDLALHGESYYLNNKNRAIADHLIKDSFRNYENSLGGGIWFKPYYIDKLKRLFCIYAYRNKQNEIIIDNQFNSEEYDYPNKSWYKEIMSQLTPQNNIGWSLPYFEKEGSNTLMVTAGSGIYIDDKLIGISTVDWEISSIVKSVSQIKPTPHSFALFADKTRDYVIACNDEYLDDSKIIGKSLKNIPWYNENLKNITYITYHNKKYIPYVKTLDNGMILIVNVPKHELFFVLYKHVFALFVLLMFTSLIISILLYIVLKRSINKPIDKLSCIAQSISSGNIDEKIKIEKPLEFAQLAQTFNKMTTDIKNITHDRERIESELNFAKKIQLSSLPNIFPPFPERPEIDIFADMEPAKEVGGDFYDFYFIDNNKLMFLIADVSGKGVPASLFMMTTKTLINSIAMTETNPAEMVKSINKKICSNNKYGFFVTMLMGILDTFTGKVMFVNCGHNPPLIKGENGSFEYKKLDTNIVLGAFEDADFTVNECQLNKGDMILLYTDGVTEAVNENDELYGEERLADVINSLDKDNVENIINGIRQNVKEYANGVLQSDDMTMVSLKYNGLETEEYVYNTPATRENYKHFNKWLMDLCDKFKLNESLQYKLELISEELYTNVCSYAYDSEGGVIKVELNIVGEDVILKFSDYGIPYDPLKRPDPDLNAPPEERDKGGLGIYIIKQYADDIEYEYKDNMNNLIIRLRNI